MKTPNYYTQAGMVLKHKTMQQTYVIENSLTENFIDQCRATFLTHGRQKPRPLQFNMIADKENGFVKFQLKTMVPQNLKRFRDNWDKFLTSKYDQELAMFKFLNKVNRK